LIGSHSPPPLVAFFGPSNVVSWLLPLEWLNPDESDDETLTMNKTMTIEHCFELVDVDGEAIPSSMFNTWILNARWSYIKGPHCAIGCTIGGGHGRDCMLIYLATARPAPPFLRSRPLSVLPLLSSSSMVVDENPQPPCHTWFYAKIRYSTYI
jgi:hypothetical protein